jgi:hypothetical protein
MTSHFESDAIRSTDHPAGDAGMAGTGPMVGGIGKGEYPDNRVRAAIVNENTPQVTHEHTGQCLVDGVFSIA